MRRLTQDQETGEPWVVFADIVLVALFLFLLFIFAQYIRYEKLTLLEELERRKQEMAELIRENVPQRDSVAIVSDEGFSQRITFSSDLLFPTCDDDLTQAGSEVVTLVGSLLKRRSRYFEAIEVEGHTDPRSPTHSERCPFEDNWELSSRRAATVVRILATDAGLEPARLSAVGRAEFRPRAATGPDVVLDPGPSDPDSLYRERRRIEMVLQYSEEDIQAQLRRAGVGDQDIG